MDDNKGNGDPDKKGEDEIDNEIYEIRGRRLFRKIWKLLSI